MKNLYPILFILLLFASCKSDIETPIDDVKTLILSTDSVFVDGTGGSVEIIVKVPKNEEWSLDPIFKSWFTATVSYDTDGGVIKLLVNENTGNKPRSAYVKVQFKESKYKIDIIQKDGTNTAPLKAEIVAPVENETDICIFPQLKWNASVDQNGDEVKYIISYSLDKAAWISSDTVSILNYNILDKLKINTTYYWRITSIDERGAVQEGDINSFTTNNKNIRNDRESWIYTGDPTMTGPIPLFFIGDGFVPKDYEEGGLFDQKIDEGIRLFFEVEPYNTYRQYFTVYKVAAHSPESGISRYYKDDTNLIEKVNTCFNTRYYGDGYNGTFMKTNTMKVYDYIYAIPGIDPKALYNTTVVLIANYHVYSGTCWIDSNGRSCSIVPTCDNNQPFSYKMTMAHEAGGHGFGQLADEYLFSDSPASEQDKQNIINWSNDMRNSNIDITGDRTKIKWRHFFGVAGYEMVSAYEGAQFRSGVWKPEPMSCMINMSPPFNAPSREAIVKRIYKNLNWTYSFDKFRERDVRPSRAQILKSAAQVPNPLIKHTSPQYVDDITKIE